MEGNEQSRDVTPSILYRRGRITFADIWTASPVMKDCLEKARLAAPYEISIIILGETGTGKNLLAQAIHNASPRRSAPFVPADLVATPQSLLADQLFGHRKGAFTDAREDRQGLFALAHRGTLFLDEVGNLPPEAQQRILTTVDSKRVRRLGDEQVIDCDVRIVSATNRDMQKAVADGEFRQDLFYRLAQLELRVPPLRERVEDIEMLAARFVERANVEFGRNVKRLGRDCLARMCEYPWPGNIRELRAKINAAMVTCLAEELQAEDVFPELVDDASHMTQSGMELALETMERRHVARVLKIAGWNVTRAAELLHISRTTLYEKMKRYDLQAPSQGS